MMQRVGFGGEDGDDLYVYESKDEDRMDSYLAR
jgi:hypothetical protein